MQPDQTGTTPTPPTPVNPAVPPPEPRPPSRRGPFTLFLLLALAAFLVVGGAYVVSKAILKIPAALQPPASGGTFVPPSGGGATALTVPTTMQKFSSVQEVAEFLSERSDRTGVTSYSRGWGDQSSFTWGAQSLMSERGGAGPMMGAPAGGLSSTVNQGLAYSTIVGWGTQSFGGVGDDYSTTNVQVTGVDEGDLIKTDGRYLYTVSGQNVFIVNAYPPENGEVLVKIQFDSTPAGLYINGTHLVVYGHDQKFPQSAVYKKFRRRGSFTFLKVFDISDRRSPRLVRDLNFEGNLASSRMIGQYVYLLTSSAAQYYEGEPPVPRILEGGAELPTTPGTGRCNCPDVYYFDPEGEGYTFTSVAAVNVVNTAEAVASDVYLVTPGQTVYVSAGNLYVTYTKRVSEEVIVWEVAREMILPLVSNRDRERIRKIEAVESTILSRAEKFAKIQRILERYRESLSDEEQERLQRELTEKIRQRWQEISRQLEQTVVHKIAIKGKELSYQTSGGVPGHVLNQFSLDEHEGFLRVATTKSRTWGQFDQGRNDSYSNLYILDDKLRIVGQVEGLAEGERIFAVRFMQGRAYLVTFRQTDPLFTVDVRDPRNPRVLGELKVPGFSDYLHPYDDATLIGLGQENGRLKLSLFDVADIAAPRELSKYLFDSYNSDSTARREHKAFLFSREKNLLVIPVNLREPVAMEAPPPSPLLNTNVNVDWGRSTTVYPPRWFRGAAVFSVDRATGFTLRGKIEHGQMPGIQPLESSRQRSAPSYIGDAEIKRSLYIKDILYTFSDQYVKANRLTDLGEAKFLRLEKQPSGDFQIIN